MAETICWEYDYQREEYCAPYKGLTLCATPDTHAQDPVSEQHGGSWPMLLRTTWGEYDKVPGAPVSNPGSRFSDALLVHCQKDLAALFDYESVADWLDDHSEWGDAPASNWTWDAVRLRQAMEYCLSNTASSSRLDMLEGLYTLLGIPNLRRKTNGSSQGEWLDMLVVATPEAQEALRLRPEGVSDEEWVKLLEQDMYTQTDTFAAWAFGDCYGWRVVREIETEDGDTEEEELDACWGYYGSDHDASGLTADARAAADYLTSKTLESVG